MSPVAVVVLVSALVTAGLMVVLVLALVRHVRLVAESLRTFQQEVRPVLEEIRAETAVARERLEDLSERSSALSRDARLRR